ncbi:Vacuolar protein sorting-associated protein 62 [Puttea exsequens]|nr:Vacuolar protein sorting-associated protein 62 [Puttea exsequens]
MGNSPRQAAEELLPQLLEQGLAHNGEKDQKDGIRQHDRSRGNLDRNYAVEAFPEGSSTRNVQPKKQFNAFFVFKVVAIAVITWVYINFSLLSSFSWLRSPVCSSTGKIFPTCSDGINLDSQVLDAHMTPKDLANDPRVMEEIPQHVFDYAPLVHLYSGEEFWPSDMAEHLLHITPELNYDPIEEHLQASNLTNLDQLNEYEKGRHVFLTSNDNVEERPAWLSSQKNIPSPSTSHNGTNSGGRSSAPSVLITVNKGANITDAFWFYFYSYNLGNKVFSIRFGNHVGDWEHSLIRFQHGVPKLVFYSEHNFGEAYAYSAVEKIGKRPVVYSAEGTHAMYATPGTHPYVLPLGILHDETDRGPLWDPALNAHTYTYDHHTDKLRASNRTASSPTNWFYFAGHWGDKLYPLNDSRQYGLVGEYHYVNGPLGPRFKHLGRRKVCQGRYTDPCVIKTWLAPEGLREPRVWLGIGEGEGWPDEGELMPPGVRDG